MGRSEREFTNLLLVEQPNGDFAQTEVRQMLSRRLSVGALGRTQRIDRPDAGRDRRQSAQGVQVPLPPLLDLGGPSR